jgi:hypothetical protein
MEEGVARVLKRVQQANHKLTVDFVKERVLHTNILNSTYLIPENTSSAGLESRSAHSGREDSAAHDTEPKHQSSLSLVSMNPSLSPASTEPSSYGSSSGTLVEGIFDWSMEFTYDDELWKGRELVHFDFGDFLPTSFGGERSSEGSIAQEHTQSTLV